MRGKRYWISGGILALGAADPRFILASILLRQLKRRHPEIFDSARAHAHVIAVLREYEAETSNDHH